jgi:hypothetical protein
VAGEPNALPITFHGHWRATALRRSRRVHEVTGTGPRHNGRAWGSKSATRFYSAAMTRILSAFL